MSSHAATIRHYLSDEFDDYSEAFAALDALLAENQQLREALTFYADYATYEESSKPHPTRFAEGVVPIREDCGSRARAAVGEE